MLAEVLAFSVCATKLFNNKNDIKRYCIVEEFCCKVFTISGMIVFARDSNRKNKADPGCSGVPGFPYTRQKVLMFRWNFGQETSNLIDPYDSYISESLNVTFPKTGLPQYLLFLMSPLSM